MVDRSWVSVSPALDGYHTCALHTGGTIYCWGRNEYGELGVGSTADSNTPKKVGSSTSWVTVKTGQLRSEIQQVLTKPTADRSIKLETRRIKPKVTTNELADKYPKYIVIDRSSFQVRLFKNLKLDKTYTVAIGADGFSTPAGQYDIQNKQVNPSWHVPQSEWAGSLAGRVIPPGPDNPIKVLDRVLGR